MSENALEALYYSEVHELAKQLPRLEDLAELPRFDGSSVESILDRPVSLHQHAYLVVEREGQVQRVPYGTVHKTPRAMAADAIALRLLIAAYPRPAFFHSLTSEAAQWAYPARTVSKAVGNLRKGIEARWQSLAKLGLVRWVDEAIVQASDPAMLSSLADRMLQAALDPSVRVLPATFYLPPELEQRVKSYASVVRSVASSPAPPTDRWSPEAAPAKARVRRRLAQLVASHLPNPFGPQRIFDLVGEGLHSAREWWKRWPHAAVYAAERDRSVMEAIIHAVTDDPALKSQAERGLLVFNSPGVLPSSWQPEKLSAALQRWAGMGLAPFDVVNLDFCGTMFAGTDEEIASVFSTRMLSPSGGILIVTLDRSRLNLQDGHLQQICRHYYRSAFDPAQDTSRIPILAAARIVHVAMVQGYDLQLLRAIQYHDNPAHPMTVLVFQAWLLGSQGARTIPQVADWIHHLPHDWQSYVESISLA